MVVDISADTYSSFVQISLNFSMFEMFTQKKGGILRD